MIEHVSFKIPTEMQQVSDKVIKTQGKKWECVLCFKKTIGRGVYAPHRDQKQRFGLQNNETAIIYAICPDHTDRNTNIAAIVNALVMQ